MATRRQKEYVDKLVEHGGNKYRTALDVGYSKNTAKTPSKIEDSKGVKALLDTILPENMILEAIAFDIVNKPKNRRGELELACRIRGMMKDKVEVDHTIISLSQLFDITTENKQLEAPQE